MRSKWPSGNNELFVLNFNASVHFSYQYLAN